MKYHLIGIGGIGVSGLAGLLKAKGHDVRGSDEQLYHPMSEYIAQLDIPVFEGYLKENLAWNPDVIVVGNVCRESHEEVVEAKRLGLPLASFPEVLNEQFLTDKEPIVVLGTHGKTTTTSLIAHLLSDAGQDPSFLVGGIPSNFGKNWQLGQGKYFVVEGDEYDTAFFDKKSKFLHYPPKIAILTSVEMDHVDIFDDIEHVRAAFTEFVVNMPPDGLLLVAASSPEALLISEKAPCPVQIYSCSEHDNSIEVDWQVGALDVLPAGRSSFSLSHQGNKKETTECYDTKLLGQHNVENIVAAIAVGYACGLEHEVIKNAVARFSGIARRQEIKGLAHGVLVIDDYAHHPTAVAQTLQAMRQWLGERRLIVLFEPRSATSRRNLFQNDYVDALSLADAVFIAPVFRGEELDDHERLDIFELAHDLHTLGIQTVPYTDLNDLVSEVVDYVHPGDVIITFSSGNFDNIHEKLFHEFEDAIVPAKTSDIESIGQLLSDSQVSDWAIRNNNICNFHVLRNKQRIIGCIGLCVFEKQAILHSLAVTEMFRSQGYGWILADRIIVDVKQRDIKDLYLFATEQMSDFFSIKLGFTPISWNKLPTNIAQSELSKQFDPKMFSPMKVTV